MAGQDLIVSDSEFYYAANRILLLGDYLCQALEEYGTILEKVYENKAIVDERITQKLEELKGEALGKREKIKSVSEEGEKLIKKFVKNIDDADSYLF